MLNRTHVDDFEAMAVFFFFTSRGPGDLRQRRARRNCAREPGFQDGERLLHGHATHLDHEIDHVPANVEAVVVPQVFFGIDFEGGTVVALADRAGVPQLATLSRHFGRPDAGTFEIEGYGNLSGLVSAHRYAVGSSASIVSMSLRSPSRTGEKRLMGSHAWQLYANPQPVKNRPISRRLNTRYRASQKDKATDS